MALSLPPIVHSHATSWHDGGVALLTGDGEIVALAAERVGDRYKHSFNSRLAYDYLRARPEYAAGFGGARDRFIPVESGLQRDDHHRFHAASSFFGSGFDAAAVLVVDGQGDRGDHIAPTSIWMGEGERLELVEELFPSAEAFTDNSLGHFYTAIGALAGMNELYEEGKTMALAAYGEPSEFLSWLRRRVYSEPDGSYRIDPDFVRAILGNTLGPRFFDWDPPPDRVQAVWDEVTELRGRGVSPAGMQDQADMDVAYAGQLLLEEMLLGLASRAERLTGCDRLCVAGGVALNCVANQRVAREGPFEELFVVPAPSDDGQALGKLYTEIKESGLPVDTTLRTAYLGPGYRPADFEDALARLDGEASVRQMPEEELLEAAASLLEDGKVLAAFHGRSEWGPRALGHRSILADPRRSEMRDHLNARVKHREWYRPLAPIVIEERAAEFFELDAPSPFMTRAVSVHPRQRDSIPAVVHVDGTARVQTVNRDQDRRCYELLRAFERSTGLPLLVNTSFNDRGKPIVEKPLDAVEAFLAMQIDALLLGEHLVVKAS